MEDEGLVLQARLHPIILLPSLLLFVFFGGVLRAFWEEPIPKIVFLVVFGGCALRFLFRMIYYLTSEFGVTSRRVLGKTGFLWRESQDIVLAKVEAVRLHQTILGRLLNYGDVEDTGTGGTEERLKFIPNPLKFRNNIQVQVGLLHDREGDSELMN